MAGYDPWQPRDRDGRWRRANMHPQGQLHAAVGHMTRRFNKLQESYGGTAPPEFQQAMQQFLDAEYILVMEHDAEPMQQAYNALQGALVGWRNAAVNANADDAVVKELNDVLDDLELTRQHHRETTANYNPHHDRLGRFAESPGEGGGGSERKQLTAEQKQLYQASSEADSATQEIDKRHLFSSQRPAASERALHAAFRGDSALAAIEHNTAAAFHEKKAAGGFSVVGGRPKLMGVAVMRKHKRAAELHREAARLHHDLARDLGQVNNMEHLVANFGRVRTETVGGREYFVAPMTMLKEGVLAGSKGPLFYPGDEIRATANAWEGVPITLYHPQSPDGRYVSAKEPSVLAAQQLGVVRNIQYTDTRKLKAEGWFDKERTKQLSPYVYSSLESGRPVGLSTGLFTDNEDAPGVYNMRQYMYVARNYRPDHLAILPDIDGACNINHGCGVLVNAGWDESKHPRDRAGKFTQAGDNRTQRGFRGDLAGREHYSRDYEAKEASIGALEAVLTAAEEYNKLGREQGVSVPYSMERSARNLAKHVEVGKFAKFPHMAYEDHVRLADWMEGEAGKLLEQVGEPAHKVVEELLGAAAANWDAAANYKEHSHPVQVRPYNRGPWRQSTPQILQRKAAELTGNMGWREDLHPRDDKGRFSASAGAMAGSKRLLAATQEAAESSPAWAKLSHAVKSLERHLQDAEEAAHAVEHANLEVTHASLAKELKRDKRTQQLAAEHEAAAEQHRYAHQVLTGNAYKESDHPRDEHGRWTSGSRAREGARPLGTVSRRRLIHKEVNKVLEAVSLAAGYMPHAHMGQVYAASDALRETVLADEDPSQALANMYTLLVQARDAGINSSHIHSDEFNDKRDSRASDALDAVQEARELMRQLNSNQITDFVVENAEDQPRDWHGRWTSGHGQRTYEASRGRLDPGRPAGSRAEEQKEATEAADSAATGLRVAIVELLRSAAGDVLEQWIRTQLSSSLTSLKRDSLAKMVDVKHVLQSDNAKAVSQTVDSALEHLSNRANVPADLVESLQRLRRAAEEARIVNHDAAEEYTANMLTVPDLQRFLLERGVPNARGLARDLVANFDESQPVGNVLDSYLLTNQELGEFSQFRNDHERAKAFLQLLEPLRYEPVANYAHPDAAMDVAELLTVNLFDVKIGGHHVGQGHWFSTCERDEHGWCKGKSGGGGGGGGRARLGRDDDGDPRYPPGAGGQSVSGRKAHWQTDAGGVYDDIIRPVLDTVTGGVAGRAIAMGSKSHRSNYDQTLFDEAKEIMGRVAKASAIGGGAIVGGLAAGPVGVAAGAVAGAAGASLLKHAPAAAGLMGRALLAGAKVGASGAALAAGGVASLFKKKAQAIPTAKAAPEPPTAKAAPEPPTAKAVQAGAPPASTALADAMGKQAKNTSPAGAKDVPPGAYELKTKTAEAVRLSRNAKKANKSYRARAHETAAEAHEAAAEVHLRAGNAKEHEEHTKLGAEHRAKSKLTYNQEAVQEFQSAMVDLYKLLVTNAEEREAFMAHVEPVLNALETETMNKAANVDWLVANCDCWKDPADRQVLNSLPPEKLARMRAAEERSRASEAVVNEVQAKHKKAAGSTATLNGLKDFVANNLRCGGGGEGAEKPMEGAPADQGNKTVPDEEDPEDKQPTGNEAQWLASAPPRIRETLMAAQRIAQQNKSAVVDSIVSNARGDAAQIQGLRATLMRKSMPELEQLKLLSAPAAEPRFTDFSLNVPGAITANDADDILALPGMTLN